jgi:glycosyltransferase involved in cell wall biosynthesis
MSAENQSKNSFQPIRVLFIINNLARAGAEGVFVRQANFLSTVGHRVFFATLFPDFSSDNLSSELIVPLVDRLFLNSRNLLDYQAIKKLIKFVDQNKIQTIYATLELPKILARLIKVIRPKVKIVIRESSAVTNQHGQVKVKDWKFKLADIILNFFTNQIIVLSQEMEHLVVQYQPWNKRKIVIIGNGIPIIDDQKKVAMRNLIKKDQPEWLVLAVASMNYYERAFEYIIEAISLLPKDKQNEFRLIFAGDGTLRTMYEKQVAELNLCDQVKFLGRLNTESLQEEYRRAHIFVMSSTAEGFPNVVLEAGSFGLPIITTPVGGATDVVREEETGFFVPIKNAQAIAEKLMLFKNDPERWYRMSLASRQRIEVHFSLNQIMKKIVEALKPNKL